MIERDEEVIATGAAHGDAAAPEPDPQARAAGEANVAAAEPDGHTAHEADESDDKSAVEGPPPGPRVVRRVVVSYQLGWLPGDWLQTWRRLDRVFARANLKVKATLAPLEDLPADTDILVVPPELRDVARESVPPGTPILVTPAGAAAGAFNDLVARLQAGTTFTAETINPSDLDKPRLVTYRGSTIID